MVNLRNGSKKDKRDGLSILVAEADFIIMEVGRMELNMTDKEKLAVVNEVTGKNYTSIDHTEKTRALWIKQIKQG